MTNRIRRAVFGILFVLAASAAAAANVSIDGQRFLVVNGKRVFPFFFMLAPPADGRTPSGEDAWRELKQYGTVFHHCNVLPGKWDAAGEARIDKMLARSAETGLLCAVAIRDLDAPKPGDTATESELRRIISKYKDNPGLGIWKGSDEPEWGKVLPERCQRFYDIVHQMDRNHPVWLIQAPRGTAESLERYDRACDIAGLDIYPVSYPPGRHTLMPNKSLSMVGDYTRWIREIHHNSKPVVMCLQICWSGVAKPGRTLRFPTFPEQRYMSYEAIINGARGLLYFGGGYEECLNERDRALGWNWTYYDRVLKPVLDELKPGGPLYPALVVPDARLPVAVEGAKDVEFTVRETANAVFLLAAKREGSTVKVQFRGLPRWIREGQVLFEEPRKVAASGGAFSDWFGPNEVHVYRFANSSASRAEK
ncbi:MAG: hypothetical protein HYS04_17310 [Acidobacteria bacterium]|nr:hypothetical protein [Acidobacteriota bacterium]